MNPEQKPAAVITSKRVGVSVVETYVDLERAAVRLKFRGASITGFRVANARAAAFRFAAEFEGVRASTTWRQDRGIVDRLELEVTPQWACAGVASTTDGALVTLEHEGRPGFAASADWKAGLAVVSSILSRLGAEGV